MRATTRRPSRSPVPVAFSRPGRPDPAEPVPAANADEPVAAPAIARRSPREERPPCDPAKLSELGIDNAEFGVTVLAIRNKSDTRCTLRGTPQIAGTHPVTGDRVIIAAEVSGEPRCPERQ